LRGHLDPAQARAWEELTGDDRMVHLRHVRECPSCRALLASDCPEALFGMLALEPLPAAALQSLSSNVQRAIEDERPAGTGIRRWLQVAGLAASLLIAGWLGAYLTRTEPEPIREAPAVARQPVVKPEDWKQIHQQIDRMVPAEGIELVSSPSSAQVVDFTVGDTRVVMIFDQELDI